MQTVDLASAIKSIPKLSLRAKINDECCCLDFSMVGCVHGRFMGASWDRVSGCTILFNP